LRALANHYADFLKVTADALDYSCHALKIDLSSNKKSQLLDGYFNLNTLRDEMRTPKTLKTSRAQPGVLSNMTKQMLDSRVKHAGLEGMLEHILSTNKIQKYKPDPAAYEFGTRAFQKRKVQFAFVASAGWDAFGTTAFGYPTFWINWDNMAKEELGITPEETSPGIEQVINFIQK